MRWRTAAIIFFILPLIPVRIKTIALYLFLLYLLYKYLENRNLIKYPKVNFIKVNNAIARMNQRFGEYLQRSKNLYLDFLDFYNAANFKKIFIPILILLWLCSGIIIVPSGEKCIRSRLGKVIDVVGPGIKYKYPWPIGSQYSINTSKINTIIYRNIGIVTSHGNHTIDLTVLWLVDDPIKYYKSSKFIEEIIANICKSIIFYRFSNVILSNNVFDRNKLLTDAKKEIQQSINQNNLRVRMIDLQLGELIK